MPGGNRRPRNRSQVARWSDAGELPPYSVTPLRFATRHADDDRHWAASLPPSLLENDYIRVELNEAGDITRIYDKTVRPRGAAAGRHRQPVSSL